MCKTFQQVTTADLKAARAEKAGEASFGALHSEYEAAKARFFEKCPENKVSV